MNEQFFCGLDLGASTLKAGILKVSHGNHFDLIDAYEVETVGFKEGTVYDLGEFSEAVYQSLNTMFKRSHVGLRDVHVGISGEYLQSRLASTMIPLTDKGSKVITTRDLDKVNKHNRLLSLKMDDEILHEILHYYQVNDDNPSINPLGLYGRKLGVESLLIMTEVNRIRNLTRAVHEAGYDVNNIFFDSYAAAKVVLTEEQKQQGCFFVDMGAQATSLLIFQQGVLKSFIKILIGGNHFTKSISHKLGLSFELAEQIKKSYALAVSSQPHLEEEILIKRENAYIPIKRSAIYEAIEPEIMSLMEQIQSVIVTSGYQEKIKNKLIIVGGASLLSGLIERMGQEMAYKVELGKIRVSLRKNVGDVSSFSGVVGLAFAGYEKSLGVKAFLKNNKLNLRQKFFMKLKELYEDYF